jgi:hypothetical protein
MSQLVLLVRARGEWVQAGWPLKPGEPGGSLSHNGPSGREVYLFECRGDHSVLLRSKAGADVELGAARVIENLDGFEEVARMDAEHPSFECWLRTDRDSETRRYRFRHEEE